MLKTKIAVSVELLKDIQLLKSLNETELKQVLSLGTALHYEPHTNIIIEGELSWGIYIILNGTVGVYKNNKLTGNGYDLGQLKNNDFFGEMSLIDDNPRSATVRTLTQCQLLHISKENFTKLLNHSADLKLRFYQNTVRCLVSRLRELDENYVISQYQLWQNAFKKGEQRA
jgi:CRP/FNR family transcriptional regulator, cyclic AMP receptor protein